MWMALWKSKSAQKPVRSKWAVADSNLPIQKSNISPSSPVRSDFLLGLENSGHFTETQREKGQTCCCIQSHSCGQGRESWEDDCWIREWKVDEQKAEPSVSYFWPAGDDELFCEFNITNSRRKTEGLQQEKNCDGNSSHESTAFYWTLSLSIKLFLDIQKYCNWKRNGYTTGLTWFILQ